MSERTTPPSYCVYLITNTANAKCYVGITNRGIERRWKEHIYDARHGRRLPLHSAMRKHGVEAFQVELLDTCANYVDLVARECHWIATLGTLAPNGYNATAGGAGHAGVPLTPEHRAKIATANRENKERRCTPAFRQRMREVALNRSPDHLAKIAAALTGRHHTPETIEKVRAARAVQVFTPESIEKRTAKLRGKTHTAQARANMSRAQKGRIISLTARQRTAHTLQVLTDAQAAVIRFDALGMRKKDYAALFGISPSTVSGIVQGHTYTFVTREHLPDDPLKVIPSGNAS